MENNSEVVYLYLDDIIPNRFQPREVFDDQTLKELAVSIKEHGVIQPIIVRKVENKYEIIAGERRYKASTMAGLTKIPAIVKNLDDKESSKVALIENLQRKDLSPIEEARTYQKILELEDGMTQEELAATMGKTQSAVSNKLRLLALPEEVQDALLKERISERHARSILNLEDKNDQIKMVDKVIAEKMTVRELDREIKEMKEGKTPGEANVNSGVGQTGNEQLTTPAQEEVPAQQETTTPAPAQPAPTAPETPAPSIATSVPLNTEAPKENSLAPQKLDGSIGTKSGFVTPKFNLATFGNAPKTESTDAVDVPNKEEAPAPETPAPVASENPTVVDVDKVRETAVDIGPNSVTEKPVTPETAPVQPAPVAPASQAPAEEKKDEGFKFVPKFNFTSPFGANNGTNPANNNQQGATPAQPAEAPSAPTQQASNNTAPAENPFAKFFNANNTASNSNLNAARTPAQPGLAVATPVAKDVTKAVNDLKTTIGNLEKDGYKVKVEESDNETEYKITVTLQKNA